MFAITSDEGHFRVDAERQSQALDRALESRALHSGLEQDSVEGRVQPPLRLGLWASERLR